MCICLIGGWQAPQKNKPTTVHPFIFPMCCLPLILTLYFEWASFTVYILFIWEVSYFIYKIWFGAYGDPCTSIFKMLQLQVSTTRSTLITFKGYFHLMNLHKTPFKMAVMLIQKDNWVWINFCFLFFMNSSENIRTNVI